jgi:hypothetical protein
LYRKAGEIGMKTLLFMILAAVCLTMTANAQIGWNLKQCKAHYGEGTSHRGGYNFKINKDLEVFVESNDGLDSDEVISRVTYSSKHPLNVQELLQENTLPGMFWKSSGTRWGEFTAKEWADFSPNNDLDFGEVTATETRNNGYYFLAFNVNEW